MSAEKRNLSPPTTSLLIAILHQAELCPVYKEIVIAGESAPGLSKPRDGLVNTANTVLAYRSLYPRWEVVSIFPM